MEFSRFKPINEAVFNALADRIYFIKGDFKNPATYRELQARLDQCDREHGTRGNRLFYLSTAPSLFVDIAQNLKQNGLAGNGTGNAADRERVLRIAESCRQANSEERVRPVLRAFGVPEPAAKS